MEKMNQISVSEFMNLTKTQMYDKAVEMVEKYNRLVDICNDSTERMAELVARHKIYTNALNNDIVDKDAKIELLEKELEGRKEGYTALKERMDTKYISIEDHNKICTHMEQESDRVIGERDAKIEKLEKEIEKWKDLANMNRDTICDQYGVCEEFKKKIAELEEKVKRQKENLDGINKTLEIRNKENESLIQVRNNQTREIEAHEAENARLSEKIAGLKKENSDYAIRVNNLTEELEKTYAEKEADLKNHNRRDMNLVDELAGKNDKIKSLVEEIEYYKNQERIRTDQLRATESKVEQLHKELEDYKDRDENAKDLINDNTKEIKELKDENSYLKKECKNKNDIIRKAYFRYVDEACKSREEIRNECYEKLTKDDTGYTGFKQYTLRALEKEEGNEKEAKKFLSNTISIIFYNKKAEEERKEEAKKELNEAFGVPCGEDSIE